MAATKVLSVITAAGLLIPNLLCYGLPGSQLRAQLTAELSDYMRLERALILNKVQLVYGDYTYVYDLNFDTHERVTAVPKVPTADCFNYGGKLRQSPVRWAAVGSYDEVEREAKVVGASGLPQQYGQLWLLVAAYPSPDAAGLVTALRPSGI